MCLGMALSQMQPCTMSVSHAPPVSLRSALLLTTTPISSLIIGEHVNYSASPSSSHRCGPRVSSLQFIAGVCFGRSNQDHLRSSPLQLEQAEFEILKHDLDAIETSDD